MAEDAECQDAAWCAVLEQPALIEEIPFDDGQAAGS